MSQARVAEAWKHYPLQIKLQGKSFTVRAMTLDDGEALQAFARELPPHDLLFMRRDITKPAGIGRWLDAVRRGAMYSILCEDAHGIAGYSSLHLTELDWSGHVADLRVATADRALALGIEKVVARMTTDQRGARGLFQELGFQPEALLKDEVKDRAGEYHDLLIMACDVETFQAQRRAFGVTT